MADWASLFGDLSRKPALLPEVDPPVEWRVHDRTHVEFAIDYPTGPGASTTHTWEAYFFVPESFRLRDGTYDKKDIYEDLWSYVRYAVPSVPFHELGSTAEGSLLDRLLEALRAASGAPDGSEKAAAAMQRLRLFACHVRASGLSAMREVERRVAEDTEVVGTFVASCGAVAGAFRNVLVQAEAFRLPDEVRTAASWTDEDISLVLETFCATLGIAMEKASDEADALGPLAEQLAAYAVCEARHRRSSGYDTVGTSDADERMAEHFEFRRHVLKRFTSSVLWLSLEVRQAATWVVHALYAVAAMAAMTFAVWASMGSEPSTSFIRYAVPLAVAYAVKDRMKALLQGVFADWIAKRFPDRNWLIRDRERDGRVVGRVKEQAGFLPFRGVPEEVLKVRRLTREHHLEEQARPERVLWHQKTMIIDPEKVRDNASDFSMLTEIFRLNLRRWLAHADDPNRKAVFADPDDALIYSMTTRRVYNVNVVYRLRAGGGGAKGTGGPYHRIRVVVSRKGIERIDAIR